MNATTFDTVEAIRELMQRVESLERELQQMKQQQVTPAAASPAPAKRPPKPTL